MLLLVSEHSSMIWFYHTFMLFRFLIIICSPKASLNSIVKYNLFLVTLNVYGFAFNSFISYAVYSFIASSPILILLYHMPLFLGILMCPFLLIYCIYLVSILQDLIHFSYVHFIGTAHFSIYPHFGSATLNDNVYFYEYFPLLICPLARFFSVISDLASINYFL